MTHMNGIWQRCSYLHFTFSRPISSFARTRRHKSIDCSIAEISSCKDMAPQYPDEVNVFLGNQTGMLFSDYLAGNVVMSTLTSVS